MPRFSPGQLVIKHIFEDSDAIPLHTVARVVSYNGADTVEITSYRTSLEAKYTDAHKWRPYIPHVSRVKAIPCKPQ